MNAPNVTQAQALAVAGWIIAQAVSYGVLSVKWESLALSITATVVAAAWKIADAVIRNGRSRALAPAPVVVSPPTPGGQA